MTHQVPKTSKRSFLRKPASIERGSKVATVKPYAHQPSKAELEADASIPTTPDTLLRAAINYTPRRR